MKKTQRTNKLVLDRQTIRELSANELAEPVGGRATNPLVETMCRSCSCQGPCNDPSVTGGC